MTLTIDKTTTSTSINLIDVLDQVQDLDKYRDYKAVTLGDGLDNTTYIWLNGVYQGSVTMGFSSNHFFNLKQFVDDGHLNKVLS